MVYQRSQPVLTDNLSVSQPILAANTNASDDSFGVEHYKFSDTTINNGFHNKVTTLSYLIDTTVANNIFPNTLPNNPPTTTTNPIFYGFQQLDAMGVAVNNLPILQFSRGPSNAAPSPVTLLQGGPIVLNSGSTTNILDFTGITLAFLILYAGDTTANTARGVFQVIWNGTTFNIGTVSTAGFQVLSTGNILQLKNIAVPAFASVYWTVSFQRIA